VSRPSREESGGRLERLLAEQRTYYRAVAPEYGRSAIPDVPLDRFESFWATVVHALKPDGRVLEELEASLRRLGWEITVRRTSGPFYWGAGHRARSDLR
jgi:hypothetical protein